MYRVIDQGDNMELEHKKCYVGPVIHLTLYFASNSGNRRDLFKMFERD